MALERELLEFAAQLQAEVIERCQSESDGGKGGAAPSVFKESVFTGLVVEDLLEAGVLENAETCYYEAKLGQGTVKVNGYGVNDDEDSVDLVVADYRHCTPPESVTPKEVRDSTERALRFYREMIGGKYDQLEGSSDAFSMGSRLHELRKSVRRLRVFYITDGLTSLKRVEGKTVDRLPVTFQVWDVERLFRNLAAGRPHEAIEIDVEAITHHGLPCLPVPSGEADYKAYLCVLSGELLYSLYEEYGSRLLELNVRSFLQARGKVNRGIRDTVLNDPGHFFPYNNGLSMTAAEVKLKRTAEGRPVISFIRGLQIVNGGQTTASLHRAKRQDKADLSRIFVQAKITEVGGDRLEEMVPKISKYANSQNAVNEADFSANHPYHIELERLSLTTWVPGEQSRWFYERARGQYQVAKVREATTSPQRKRFELKTPASQRFTKTDLAKFVNSWECLPHIVSRGGQKNFVLFMDQLRSRGAEWLPDTDYYRDLIAKAIIYKQAQRIANEEQFPAYRANIVAYTVAYLSHATGGQLDLKQVWQEQSVGDAIQKTLRRWSRKINEAILDSAGVRNVTEWCKKGECWDTISALQLDVPSELMHNLNSGSGSQPHHNGKLSKALTREDLANIAQCKAVSSEEWLRVHGWGTKSSGLTYWEKGVALTLSSYASSGWSRSPSPKQARIGVQALEKARRMNS
jgi:hypothetical protein